MNHLIERRTVTGKGYPSDMPADDHPVPDCHPGALPRTDELLSRSISIGTGIRHAVIRNLR